jgi:hypothetical protein
METEPASSLISGTNRRLACVAVLIAASLGCSRSNKGSEENQTQLAYIAPASVNVRSQLNQKNSTVAVLHHADRVTILDARRRFVKIRVPNGVEGWTDSQDLLNPGEMRRVLRERDKAKALPSEGVATAYEALNMHLDPSRKSPAFSQIPEGAPVSILARRLTAKNAAPPKAPIIYERPKPPARKQRNRQSKVGSSKPPFPPPPGPPANWRTPWGIEDPEGSEHDFSEAPKRSKATLPEKPPILESWNLVRTKDDRIGWVLSRNLMMSIPDEVAQYAAGKHITSYFELGTVHDDKQGAKHDWLLTTVSDVQPVDFDAWRVFVWNRRRHRYETSYRQHGLEGYFPVHVEPAVPSVPGRVFKLITRDDDGTLRLRSYRFDGLLVHLVATENYQSGVSTDLSASVQNGAKQSEVKTPEGWFTRLKQRLFKKN